VTQAVEHQPSKHKALSSNPSTIEKKNFTVETPGSLTNICKDREKE
jgi:hypothetical protein